MMRVFERVSWIAAPVLAFALAGCCDSDTPLGVAETSLGGQTTVALGTAGTFGVFAGDSVINTGTTTIGGSLGVSPDSIVTGFPPGTLTGTIQAGNVAAATALAALIAAYNDAAARTTGAVTVGGELAGEVMAPGLFTSTTPLTLNGDLTLNAFGDSNAVFIIQAPSLTTGAGSRVLLAGGAQASNVIWQIGTSATLGANSEFEGTILANQNITLMNGAQLNGRALARTGTVTLDDATITIP